MPSLIKSSKLVFTISLVLFAGWTLAQDKPDLAVIAGVVQDSTERQPLAFVSVELLTKSSSRSLGGSVTNEKGEFQIKNIPVGEYKLSIQYAGYKDYLQAITVDSSIIVIPLGIIYLAPQAHELKTVTVEAIQDLIEEKIDRTVYNAEKDNTIKGGTALDALRRVPLLSVDAEGNVSLRGNASLKVLLNNKPSSILAANLAEVLKQIPAEQIQSVEVITSPSARYEAEGVTGIINIITKKNKVQGYNMGFHCGLGFRNALAGLNGALKMQKLGITLWSSGGVRFNEWGRFENRQQTVLQKGESFSSFQQAQTRGNGSWGYNSLELDYELNKYHYINASIGLNLGSHNNFQDELLGQTFRDAQLVEKTLRNVENNNSYKGAELSLNYTRTFQKPQKEWTVLSLWSVNNGYGQFTNRLLDPFSGLVLERLKNVNPNQNQEISFETNYQVPFGESRLLEVGGKQIVRYMDSDFEYFSAQGPNSDYQRDTSQLLTNQMNYTQAVSALYSSYTHSFQKGYSLKLGARYEYTLSNAGFQNASPIEIPSYGALIPSITLAKKWEKKGMLKLTYNRRLQRPSLYYVNPNRQAANPLNVWVGNPNLSPEFTHNIQLAYSVNFQKLSFQLASYIRTTGNSIQSIRQTIGQDTLLTSFQNIGEETAYGNDANITLNLSKLNLRLGTNFYYLTLNNNIDNPVYAAKNQGFIYQFNVSGNYTLPAAWSVSAYAYYSSGYLSLQGRNGIYGYYSLAINKEFKNKKANINFGFDNFLNFNGLMRIDEFQSAFFSQTRKNLNQNLSFRVVFRYKIGKMKWERPERQKKSIRNDDAKSGE